MPLAVRYALGLLWLQGSIWIVLAGFSGLDAAVFLAGHRPRDAGAAVAVLIGEGALAGGFGVLKIGLARRLARGGDRFRKAAVAVEIAMTCLGVLLAGAGGSPSGGVPADFVLLAAGGGAGLSLVAALGLLGRPARGYCAASSAALRAAGGRRRDDIAGFAPVGVTPARFAGDDHGHSRALTCGALTAVSRRAFSLSPARGFQVTVGDGVPGYAPG